jgi:hypothetical protein
MDVGFWLNSVPRMAEPDGTRKELDNLRLEVLQLEKRVVRLRWLLLAAGVGLSTLLLIGL